MRRRSWVAGGVVLCIRKMLSDEDSCTECVAKLEKNREQLFPNLRSVENLDARNLPIHNVEDEHPLVGSQSHVAVTRAETALWFGTGVKSRAEVVLATASVVNSQGRNLGSQFRFALLGQESLKFACELGECVSEERLFLSLLIHRYLLL